MWFGLGTPRAILKLRAGRANSKHRWGFVVGRENAKHQISPAVPELATRPAYQLDAGA